MVKITPEMIVKHASHTKKRREESDSQYLKRLTHLYLQERSIAEIENMGMCKNLSVLYLYDNKIKEIKNLSFATNLTHLYLQRNELLRIAGLDSLAKLTKLYLGQNSISVVERLENLTELKELHIESQCLPDGEQLLFDPRTVESLSRSLEICNVSGNNLEELSDLYPLQGLTQLLASNNNLSSLNDIANAVKSWPYLSRLDLTGNEVINKAKYKDKVITSSHSLVMLDGKEVPESTRVFLKNWNASKTAKTKAKRNAENRGVLHQEFHQSEIPHGEWQHPRQTHVSKQQRQFEAVLAKAGHDSYTV